MLDTIMISISVGSWCRHVIWGEAAICRRSPQLIWLHRSFSAPKGKQEAWPLCLSSFSRSLAEVRSLHNKWQLRIIACCCHRNPKADLCTTLFSLSLSVFLLENDSRIWTPWPPPPPPSPFSRSPFSPSLSPLLLPLWSCFFFLLTPSFLIFFFYLSLSVSPLPFPPLSVLPRPPRCVSSKLNLRSLSRRVLHMQKAGSCLVYACVCVLFAADISEEWGWVEIQVIIWQTENGKMPPTPPTLYSPITPTPQTLQLPMLLSCGRSFCRFLHPEQPDGVHVTFKFQGELWVFFPAAHNVSSKPGLKGFFSTSSSFFFFFSWRSSFGCRKI